MKKNYEVKFDWVKSEKIDKVGLVTLNHENSLNPLSAGFVEAIYLTCKKFDDDEDINCKEDKVYIASHFFLSFF